MPDSVKQILINKYHWPMNSAEFDIFYSYDEKLTDEENAANIDKYIRSLIDTK